ncbi:MAG TPA: LPXTG cell wall anchor domain-containing protein [Arcobacter sp.]|nr:LPXTG cell wall anchor domain-containing protein [Arcobacter sp.]
MSAWVQVIGGLVLGGGLMYWVMRRRRNLKCEDR